MKKASNSKVKVKVVPLEGQVAINFRLVHKISYLIAKRLNTGSKLPGGPDVPAALILMGMVRLIDSGMEAHSLLAAAAWMAHKAVDLRLDYLGRAKTKTKDPQLRAKYETEFEHRQIEHQLVEGCLVESG